MSKKNKKNGVFIIISTGYESEKEEIYMKLSDKELKTLKKVAKKATSITRLGCWSPITIVKDK